LVQLVLLLVCHGICFFPSKILTFSTKKIGIIIILGANLTNFAYYQGKILQNLQYKKWKKNFMHKGFVGLV
jgi:hypothetical protein